MIQQGPPAPSFNRSHWQVYTSTPGLARVALTILRELISYDKEAMPIYSRFKNSI